MPHTLPGGGAGEKLSAVFIPHKMSGMNSKNKTILASLDKYTLG